MNKIFAFFSLFGSVGTLLCCALPVTLVSLGMGATFASLTASFPQIIWLTERKEYLFAITAVLLVISFFMIRHSQKLPCPIDPALREACTRSRRFSRRVYIVTVVLYLIGLSYAYIIPKVFYGM